jgi:hypothetical protein
MQGDPFSGLYRPHDLLAVTTSAIVGRTATRHMRTRELGHGEAASLCKIQRCCSQNMQLMGDTSTAPLVGGFQKPREAPPKIFLQRVNTTPARPCYQSNALDAL